MKFYGNAQETGQQLLQAFQSGTVPAALAPIFVRHGRERHSARWSWSNQLLMALHGYSDARTYKGWQESGRQVRRGEKAFYILEPVKAKVTDEQTGEEKLIVVGFKAGARFGLEQTDGDPLPGQEEQERFVQDLPLLEVARTWGIRVGTYQGREGDAMGYYRSGLNPAIALGVENLATWAHELVHAADDRLGNFTERGQHWRSETVAELGGCILLHLLGQPAAADSGGAWHYIREYARANDMEPLAACVQVLDRTCQAVGLILDTAAALPA